MSSGGWGYWVDPNIDKARLREENKKKKRDREEAERWTEQGYVSFDPPKPHGNKACLDILATDYVALRDLMEGIEETIQALGDEWSEKDRKRLDKAVVLIGTGAKYIEKALKLHGFVKMRAGKSIKVKDPTNA